MVLPNMQDQRSHGARWVRPLVVLGVVALFALTGLSTTTAHDARTSDEHGTLTLSFETVDEECEIHVIARNVDVSAATIRVLRDEAGQPNLTVQHEEEVVGAPEDDGEGFHFEEGPFSGEDPARGLRFILEWADGDHRLSRDWSGDGCENDPRLRVHQDAESGAVTTVQGCTFFIEGQYIRAEEGEVNHLELGNRGPRLSIPVTVNDTEPEEDAVGHRFFVGPVEVESSVGFAIAFWPADGLMESRTFFRLEVEDCGVELEGCPSSPVDFHAVAHEDGSLTIHADGLDRPAGLHRTVSGAMDFVHVTDLNESTTEFRDVDTEAGTTYTYGLRVNGQVCEELEATAIPVFPNVAAGALAVAAAVGGYALMRRRR